MPCPWRTKNKKQGTRNKNFQLRSFPSEKQVSSFKFKLGFSLIEFLIVITIFGITASLITASYLNFERNQRLKNAALQLKNDLRLIQNNALSGNKGVKGGTCNPDITNLSIVLVGWYLTLNSTSDLNEYTIARDCDASGTETPFDVKTVVLPKGINIDSFYFDNDCSDPASNLPVDILFEPLKNGVTFHNSTFTTPPFYESGSYKYQLNPGSGLCIKLTLDSSIYKVIIQPSGEVSESKD